MTESYNFAVDVFRTVCDRLAMRATDLRMMVEADLPFEEWIVWELYLACKPQVAADRYCEVEAKPTYASEGAVDGDGNANVNRGGLRVGGANDGANHCWLFAEFVLLRNDDWTGDAWHRRIEAAVNRLLWLGWKRSASLLVAVVVCRGDESDGRAESLAGRPLWNRPGLIKPFTIAMPGGGSVVVKAFDIKRDPADTLTKRPLL